jgi:hypothetical protein
VVGGVKELGGIAVSVVLLFGEASAAWKEQRKEREGDIIYSNIRKS